MGKSEATHQRAEADIPRRAFRKKEFVKRQSIKQQQTPIVQIRRGKIWSSEGRSADHLQDLHLHISRIELLLFRFALRSAELASRKHQSGVVGELNPSSRCPPNRTGSSTSQPPGDNEALAPRNLDRKGLSFSRCHLRDLCPPLAHDLCAVDDAPHPSRSQHFGQ